MAAEDNCTMCLKRGGLYGSSPGQEKPEPPFIGFSEFKEGTALLIQVKGLGVSVFTVCMVKWHEYEAEPVLKTINTGDPIDMTCIIPS